MLYHGHRRFRPKCRQAREAQIKQKLFIGYIKQKTDVAAKITITSEQERSTKGTGTLKLIQCIDVKVEGNRIEQRLMRYWRQLSWLGTGVSGGLTGENTEKLTEGENEEWYWTHMAVPRDLSSMQPTSISHLSVTQLPPFVFKSYSKGMVSLWMSYFYNKVFWLWGRGKFKPDGLDISWCSRKSGMYSEPRPCSIL